MSVGYRVFGFCNVCHAEMPDRIAHDDPTQFRGLKVNLRRIVSTEHGWDVGQRGDKDYCTACLKNRIADVEADRP